MENNTSQEGKKKGFFAKLFEKLDKKLEDKAKNTGCCCGPSKDKKDSNGTDSLSSQNKGNQCCPSPHSAQKNKDLDGDSCCG